MRPITPILVYTSMVLICFISITSCSISWVLSTDQNAIAANKTPTFQQGTKDHGLVLHTPIPTVIATELDHRLSTPGGEIVFLSSSNIYLLDPNARTVARLLSNDGWYIHNPNLMINDEIYYLSNQYNPDGGVPEIYRVNKNNLDPKQITTDGNYKYNLSSCRNQQNLLFVEEGQNEKNIKKVYSQDINRDWNPKNQYSTSSEIIRLICSPDSKTIAIVQKNEVDPENRDVILLSIDFSNALTLLSGVRLTDLTWSNDGKNIVYVEKKKDTEVLQMIDVENQNIAELVLSQSNFHIDSPVFSPDNNQILYTLFSNDSQKVMILEIANLDQRQLLVSNHKVSAFIGFQTTWSPDGSYIFYFDTISNTASGIPYIIQVRTGEKVRIIDQEFSFPQSVTWLSN